MKNFRSISIPKAIIDEIEKWIKNKEILHNTVASYIEYSIRKQMEQTKQEIIQERQHQEHLKTIGLKN